MLPLTLRLLFLLSLLFPGLAAAEENSVPPMPKDMDQVDFFLLTVGRGKQIDSLFGHSIIRVHDHLSGDDMGFNWGIFDFNNPLFVWNFYRGELRYMLGIYDVPVLIDFYRNVEHRSITQQRLVLTLKQKTALMQRFIRNALPANVYYQYSQLRDNCATRPRDHLDAVLGGKIGDAYRDRLGAATYRQHMTASASPVWWVNLGLDVLTNDVLDKPLTNWEEMFLPSRLEQLLEQLPAYDDDGKEIPGQTLLTDPQRLVNLPDPMPGLDPYACWLLIASVPLLLFLYGWWGAWSQKRLALLLGLVSLLFGFWSAVWGTLFTSNWLFSNYIEAQHDALLWLLWPADWIFVVYGVLLLRRRTWPAPDSRLTQLVRALSLLHLAGFVLACILWASGAIHQHILPMLASFGIYGALYYVAMSRLCRPPRSALVDA